MKKLSLRDKSVLIGFYLSKFDSIGLEAIGFSSFTEAFNALGYAIGTKPASIKNYRDEFDPYNKNPRKGWHKRKMREYCKEIFDTFSTYSLSDFVNLINSFLVENYDIGRTLIDDIATDSQVKNTSDTIAKRLITGKSAEEFFKINYHLNHEFSNYKLQDTTNLACGFDFMLTLDNSFFCIEVKGMSGEDGSILLTQNEYIVAQRMKEHYCLYIVRNFKEKPYSTLIFNPANSDLNFRKAERTIIQVTYSLQIHK